MKTLQANDACTSCGKAVASMAVLHAGRLYCSWDCTGVVARAIPGDYFG